MMSHVLLVLAAVSTLGFHPAVASVEAAGSGDQDPLGVCVYARPVDPTHEYCVWVPQPR